jgi:DNA replication licensing factor MCM4
VETVSVIWGTDIELVRTQEIFTYFLRNFTLNHVKIHRGLTELDLSLTPYYPRLLEEIGLSQMNHLSLDVEHLCAFDATQDLAQQLIAYPQEIIPIMDECVAKVYEDMFPNDQLPSIQVRPFNLEQIANMRQLDPNGRNEDIRVK